MLPECRLGYNNLHVIPSPQEELPEDYVMVQYICPCGEFNGQFALHRFLLYHLMGRTERLVVGPHARPYVQMLNALQATAILEGRRQENKDKDKDEEFPDR